MMDIRPIRTEDDYNRALAEFEAFFDNEPSLGSDAGDRFEMLGMVLRAYEDRHWPIGIPGDPVEVLHFAINSMGRSQAELGDLLGSRPRASEVLTRKRALTIEMIDKISAAWRIPAELLAKPYSLDTAVPRRRGSKAAKAKKARASGKDKGSFKVAAKGTKKSAGPTGGKSKALNFKTGSIRGSHRNTSSSNKKVPGRRG